MPHVEIRVKGCLDKTWSEWFDDFKISHTGANETLLEGEVQDQSAIYGLIARLRDLGLSLIEVKYHQGINNP